MYHSHICSKTQVFKYFLPRWSCPHEKMAIACKGNWKIATTLGLPQSTTKRWLQRLRSESEMVSHNVGRPRGAEAGVCLVSRVICPTSLELCGNLCDLSVGPMIKTGARSCRITDQRLGRHRAVLFSRLCSQTGAGVWYRAQPPQRPEAHDGGALASEAGVMWRAKNQNLTAPNKRRRLEWCTSMLQRLGEASRPHSGASHARHTFLSVSEPFFRSSNPLCKRPSRRSLSYSIAAAVSRFFVELSRLRFGAYSFVSRCPLSCHDAVCELYHL